MKLTVHTRGNNSITRGAATAHTIGDGIESHNTHTRQWMDPPCRLRWYGCAKRIIIQLMMLGAIIIAGAGDDDDTAGTGRYGTRPKQRKRPAI